MLIHRVSQGSGIMLLTDAELREMAKLGREAGIEVSLFVGPRAGWDTGAQVQSSAGKNLGARLRGMDQVVFAAEDIRRACGLGIRSVLVAGEGLAVAGERDEARRRAARRSGAESLGADGHGQPDRGALDGAARRDDLQRADRSVLTAPGRHPPGSCPAAGYLRRGARRLRRLRTLLRGARDGARRRAGLRQAWPAQRAEYLP